MNIFVVGINHRTAPLDIREMFCLSDDEKRQVLRIYKEKYFSECFIVSTCNRTEFYGILDPAKGISPSNKSQYQELYNEFFQIKKVDPALYQKNIYRIDSVNALSHLFRVASGIDSMIIGDVQILGQIRDDFQIAIEEKTIGVLTHKALQSALHVGKRVKTETLLTEGAVSVSYAAVELASKIFANLSDKKALLIGAGKTGELTAKHLMGRGIGELYIANRTRKRAEELTAILGGVAADYETFKSVIPSVDIIISSVGAADYVLTAADLKNIMKQRSQPLFIIDIGVPRNIDPEINDMENVFLNDMDSLSSIVNQNIHKRISDIPKVNAIIIDELKVYHNWYKSLRVNPTIYDLRNHFENVRKQEVAKHINKFSESDRELIEILTKRIVNKLLHNPTINLRNGNDDADDVKKSRLDFVRNLFGLYTKEKEGSADDKS